VYCVLFTFHFYFNTASHDHTLHVFPIIKTESVFNAVSVHPFGMHDTVGVGVELAAEYPRVFFVCNGALVSMMSLGDKGEELSSVWPAIGSTSQGLQISTNFGERPFQAGRMLLFHFHLIIIIIIIIDFYVCVSFSSYVYMYLVRLCMNEPHSGVELVLQATY
jgi:hypothetical protein